MEFEMGWQRNCRKKAQPRTPTAFGVRGIIPDFAFPFNV
jgi:hypothetical protein